MNQSLDQIEEAQFAAKARPMDASPVEISLRPGPIEPIAMPKLLSLDGEWRMAPDGDLAARVAGEFGDAIPARVPGSVHLALEEAGRIPNPKIGHNDALARAESFRDWYFVRTFPRPEIENPRLVFDGVANKCGVFLNGHYLGEHGGMFGAFEFPIGEHLRDENLLVVRVLPAPYEAKPDDWFPGANFGWWRTVTINNVYGWHYCNIPCLGIWRSVRVEKSPTVRMERPFFAVHDLAKGEVDLRVDFQGTGPIHGRLAVEIRPENFEGQPFHFEMEATGSLVRGRFVIPEARLWWPNGVGAQNLYRAKVVFHAESGTPQVRETIFGLRTVEMAPLPAGPREDVYNWTFVINGRPMFVKGTGWCTLDSSLDFSRERYARFLTMARDQHVQMVRAWGSGMPETDDFYNLCDQLGLMVMQEWPTAWNSQTVQPLRELQETVTQNTLRLRNHPSLVMWGGGNESLEVEDMVIDWMGRTSIELDGTRPFHRGEPRGGSEHNYDCWWGLRPLDHNVAMEAPFWGEFGIASLPVEESVRRYLPTEEQSVWPPTEDGAFAHHTPIFNRKEDLQRLRFYAESFSSCATMAECVEASQVAQATALRHTLERARVRWPECSGALYYKMNDNHPAVSWSTADWYGAAKIAHYFCQDAFSPVHACVLVPKLDLSGAAIALPVYLLDDHGALRGQEYEVKAQAYDGRLALLSEQVYRGRAGEGEPVRQVGELTLTAAQTSSVPLLLVVEWRSGSGEGRTFCWLNYEARQGALFDLPRTTLSLEISDGTATVTNVGSLPAVGAHVLRRGHLESFTVSDNYFWLEAGESRTLQVSEGAGLSASAWNHA